MENDKCLICGEPLANGRHLRKHKISKEVYLRMYVDPDHGFCPLCGKMKPYVNGKLRKCNCKKKLYYYLLSGSSTFMMIQMFEDESACRSSYIISRSPVKYFLAHESKNLAAELGMEVVTGTHDGYQESRTKVEELIRIVNGKFYPIMRVYSVNNAVIVTFEDRPYKLLFTKSAPAHLITSGLAKLGFIRSTKEINLYYSYDESVADLLKSYEFI